MISDQDKQLISIAISCQSFKSSEMYGLLDAMMERYELAALAELAAERSGDKDKVFALTCHWQARRSFRQWLKEEIDSNIVDARGLIAETGLDPDEWQLRSEISG